MQLKINTAMANKKAVSSRIILYGILIGLLGGLFWIGSAYNYDILLFINGAHSSLMDSVMQYVTHLGDGFTAVMICLWLLVLAPHRGVAFAIALILLAVLSPSLKIIFDMPRPASVLEQIHIIGNTFKHNSFPSGHTATAIALATTMAGIGTGIYSWLIIGAAVLAGISRIYVGAHFPIDVIAGTALGLIAGVAGLETARLIKFAPGGIVRVLPRIVILSLIAVVAIIILLFYEVAAGQWFFYLMAVSFGAAALVKLLFIIVPSIKKR